MISSTGNTIDYAYEGTLMPFNVKAHYNRRAAANILSFHKLAQIADAHMLYDSRVADCFRLIYDDGREAQFANNGDGLYIYVDPSKNKAWNNNKEGTRNIQLVQTVDKNEQLMTEKEVERAKAALDLQEYLGWPSIEEFLKIVRGNEGVNIDVNVDDIKRAVHLYGIPSAYLKGRMTRRRPLKHDTLDSIHEPLPVNLYDKRLEIYIDIFKFGGLHFMLIESSRVKYVDIEYVASQAMVHIVPILQKVLRKYKLRGLDIVSVHIDNQFYNEEFAQGMLPIKIIPYSADEHVSIAERRNRTVKERMRSIIAGLPYKSIPKIMIRGLARKVQQMLNSFPARKNGVSDTILPAEIVEGVRKPDFSMKRVNFGQYVEIHDGTDNTAAVRSKGAIAMYATNTREGFAFMCLDTGRSRHSNSWTTKPISTEVIARVEAIAKDSEKIEDILKMETEEEIVNGDMEYIKQKVIRSLERQQIEESDDNSVNDNDDIEHNELQVNDDASEQNQDQDDENDNNLERVVTDEELSDSNNHIDSEDESTSKPNAQLVSDNIEQNDDVTAANFSVDDEQEQRYDNDELNNDKTDTNTENEKQELNIDMDNDKK